MCPIFAIIGRSNVGKSTLFNVLTQSRSALVADQPGLTRDRKFGRGQLGSKLYWVIDTGGLSGANDDAIGERITRQASVAVQEADAVLFLVDGRAGLTVTDELIAQRLRQFNVPIHLVINKAEGLDKALISAEFQILGFSSIYAISAAHRQGIQTLMETVLANFAAPAETPSEPEESIKVAIIGRPNVGKSTLINRILGYERVITFDQPGTTRDSIEIPFSRDNQAYTLIDTAGVRRRAKVFETLEKFSVLKTFQAIADSHVVLVLLDAREGITDQDANLLGDVLEQGRALVIAVNKWDGLSAEQRQQVNYHLERKLHFIQFAKVHFISALHGSGVGDLFASIKKAWQAAFCHVNTRQLNEILKHAVDSHPPPLVQGRRIKLRYIHQGGHNPPLFIIHGNQVNEITNDYKRYLSNTLRETLNLEGTPIEIIFKLGENPFQGRKNSLTPHQQRKRQRLLRYVKKNG